METISIEFTEDELKVILHDIIMMSGDKNHTQPELDNQVQAVVKINEALAKLEEEKTYPVQAIFEDFKDKKYDWLYEKHDKKWWFRWCGGVLTYIEDGNDMPISSSFLYGQYYRRERKNNA